MINKQKTAVYYRVSKKSKNDIRMQRKVCSEYCLQNGIKIFEEYVDKGFSGINNNRPALKKLLEDIDSGKIERILVYKLDRLGRNFSHINNFVEDLEKKKIKLVSATQKFDNSTPEGKFMFRLLTILAEFESGMISRRTIDGISARGKNK